MKIDITLPNMEFNIMWKENILGTIIVKDHIITHNKNFTGIDVFYPFNKGDVTEKRIYDFFEDRCFSKQRGDLKKLLEALDLESYDALEIVKKTRGILFDDFLWISFNDDNFTWRNVNEILQS